VIVTVLSSLSRVGIRESENEKRALRRSHSSNVGGIKKREFVMAQTAQATDTRAEMERLVSRLDDGWNKIVGAQANGQDVTRWEDVWLRLLSEYEAAYEALSDEVTR